MGNGGIEKLLEKIRTGDSDALVYACDEFVRMWRIAPVEELLLLKEQFMKLDMEHREAHLEELLVSIAEKRPAPFTAIVSDPSHRLWRPALEVLSLLGDDSYLDLFISLIPSCEKKELKELVRAIGTHRCDRAARALGSILSTTDESVFLETVLALKRCSGPEAKETLKDALREMRMQGSPMAAVVEAVLLEMDAGEVPA